MQTIVDLKAGPRIQAWLLRKNDEAMALAALQLIDHSIRHTRWPLTIRDQVDDAGREAGGMPLQDDENESIANGLLVRVASVATAVASFSDGVS